MQKNPFLNIMCFLCLIFWCSQDENISEYSHIERQTAICTEAYAYNHWVPVWSDMHVFALQEEAGEPGVKPRRREACKLPQRNFLNTRFAAKQQ